MNRKNFIYLLLACLTVGTYVHAQSYEENMMTDEMKAIIATYEWFNDVNDIDTTVAIYKEDVGKHFSEDAQMITNGQLICTGVNEHTEHFIELKEHYQFMHVDVDKIDMRQSGDRVYLQYVLYGKDNQGKDDHIQVMGYMVVKNGKVQRFDEVIAHG